VIRFAEGRVRIENSGIMFEKRGDNFLKLQIKGAENNQ